MKRLLLALLGLLLLAPAASAHGDTGVLELIEGTPAGDLEVHYVVLLTYENDSDPVSSRDVTVTVADGAPQPMTSDGDGRYSATVRFGGPGDHVVRFAVDDPAAELEHLEGIAAPTTTASTADGVSAETDTSITGTSANTSTEDDEGGSAWLLVVMGVIVVVMVTLAVAFFRGRRPPPPTSARPSSRSST